MTDGTKYEAEGRTDIESGQGLYEAFVEIDTKNEQAGTYAKWEELQMSYTLTWDALAREIRAIAENGRAARANHEDAERRLLAEQKNAEYLRELLRLAQAQVVLLRDVIVDIIKATKP